jgi:MFS family permease
MDLWGRKWFLVGGTSLACIGDIIISRATTPAMEVAGFVVASIGQALALPASYAVPSEIIPRKWRPEALAGFNISTVAGALFTLLVGTVIVDDSVSGWRT